MGQNIRSYDRQPVVAGRFYPGEAAALGSLVDEYLAMAPKKRAEHTLVAMSPHAGYPYSGPVAGVTLGQANLADTAILLGPNHTGHGGALDVWPKGSWLTPGCGLPVHEELAERLAQACPELTLSGQAHLGEHSLEVLLPFLCRLKQDFRIVPVCVAEPRLEVLAETARAMARVLMPLGEGVSLVVSSDMSHYVSQREAKSLDTLALARILALDPEGLYATVRSRGISMCGVLPMTMALFVAKAMGAAKADMAAYATSGDATGDYEQVVGYAGVIIS